jgi:hypothetical protein
MVDDEEKKSRRDDSPRHDTQNSDHLDAKLFRATTRRVDVGIKCILPPSRGFIFARFFVAHVYREQIIT